MSFLADRLARIKPSPTMAITAKAAELKAEGRDVIGLGAGEPDFDTPENIKQAGIQAIRDGATKYTKVDGMPELKAAIARKFKRDNGLDYAPEQITVGAGGKQIITNAFAATIDPGDEVIVPAPYWVTYPDSAKVWGAVPVVVECPQAQGFKLLPDQLDAAVTERTKWLIINSPSNPSGATYSADELNALAAVLRNHPHVLIMSDDIYEHIVFDDRPFTTLLQVAPDLADRVLIVNGVSKTYCMTGWRIGYGAGPKPIIQAMAKMQGQTTTHPSSIGQYATIEALNGDQSSLATHRDAYRARRDHVVAALNDCDGIDCLNPEGAFYVYPSCEALIGKSTPDGQKIESDEDFGKALLATEGVAVVHGAAFGLEPHFRVSYATSTEVLTDACERIQRFCASLK